MPLLLLAVDPWDAQWDMRLGLIGGAVGFFALGPIHDRSMASLRLDGGGAPGESVIA